MKKKYSYSKTNENLEVFNKQFLIRTPVCLFVCLFLFVLSMLQKQTLDVAKLRYDHTIEGE